MTLYFILKYFNLSIYVYTSKKCMFSILVNIQRENDFVGRQGD